MIKHVVMMTFKPETTSAQIDAVDKAMAQLPSKIPEIKAYEFGRNCADESRNLDYSLVAEFENMDDFQTYSTHPEHLRLLKDATKPILERFYTSQFELD